MSTAPPGAAPETQAPSEAEPWGPARIALGIGALLGATVVEAGIVVAFDSDLSSLGAKLALQAMLAVTLVTVAFTVSATGGQSTVAPAVLGLRRPQGRYIRIAILAYLAYFAFALVYSPLTHPHQRDVTRDLGYGDGVAADVAAGLLIVVAAPISEEIFFRGFVFGGLRNRMSFAFAGPISAVIFGAFHYTGAGSLEVLPQLAVLGFALAFVKERTGSIYPTMAIHALNNALAFAILTS